MQENKIKNDRSLLRWVTALMLFGTVMVLFVSPALAQNYPAKPISLIVPFAPGGGVDVAARVIANFMQPILGQPIVVENKPGAAGQIGWSALAKAEPDGYTMGFISYPSILLVKMLRENVPFQMSDFTTVANVQTDPGVIVVHPDSPFKTMKDLVEFAKKNPGKLNLGGDGPLSNWHLQAVVIEKQLGIKTNFISYNGSAPANVALMGQQVDATISGLTAAVAHLKEKRLRALALVDREIFAMMPDIPLIKAATGVDVSPIGTSRRGISVPKGVSEDKIKVLEGAFAKLMTDPKFISKANEMGILLQYMDAKQSSEALARDEKEVADYVNLLKK